MNSELLKEELKNKNKTIEDLYKYLNISKSAMFRKLKGTSYFKAIEIKQISEFLKLSNKKMNMIFFD